ncbi:MAG TPA: UDP-glucose 4-epimerase, partial [Gammaproteobacteria bacterium]|nr:UDP-glucose 4-epimerase [Gammaproteobacteria bacterium]
YGWSKLISENMILDMAKSDDFNAVILRYFNVAGADMKGRTGQKTKNATLLIKIACEVATGKRPCLQIYGDDYPTPDGTGVRDYIHVNDLVDAHICALDFLSKQGKTLIMNCGYGHGSSVLQVVDCVEHVIGEKVNTKISPRRAGDAASVIADPNRIQNTLDWVPKYDDLDVIVRSALAWEEKLEGEKQT